MVMLNFPEIIILLSGMLILGITIYYFVITTRNLSKTLRESKEKLGLTAKKKPEDKNSLIQPSSEEKYTTKPGTASKPSAALSTPKKQKLPVENHHYSSETILTLKDTVLRQEDTLKSLLYKIEELETSAESESYLKKIKAQLEAKVENLQLELEEKENELKKQKQQEGLVQQMTFRIDEVYKDFEVLHQKMITMESGAQRANTLSLELEDMKQSHEQLHKDLVRKQEKLEQVISENQRLLLSLSETEDKLSEANLQRQQLIKKVQFLQDINDDMQNISETNHKLQNELRRIGELESMLSIMTEERSRLFKKGEK